MEGQEGHRQNVGRSEADLQMRLPPEVINEFELRVKGVVDGVLVGKFRSRSFGGSPEFAEYRPYNPGDDPRRIDWKVYARSRRLFLKVFFHESEIPLLLLYDDSRSMTYQGKDRMAALFGGALAYMAYRGNNAVSLLTLSGRYVPPGRGYAHVLRIYGECIKGEGATSHFRKSVLRALAASRKRILVAIVSDFAFPLKEVEVGINLLARHHEVVAVHVVAPGEWNFSDDGRVLVDLETGERLSVPPNSRSIQRARIRGWISSVRRAIVEMGGRYSLVLSDEDFSDALRRVVGDIFAV